jgi:hypothetical protein
MDTIRESFAVAELPREERTLPQDPASRVSIPPSTRERNLALEIRMTTSSLIGIALMDRDRERDPESR